MTPEAWGGDRLINSIALRIRQSLKLDEILNATVMEVRQHPALYLKRRKASK